MATGSRGWGRTGAEVRALVGVCRRAVFGVLLRQRRIEVFGRRVGFRYGGETVRVEKTGSDWRCAESENVRERVREKTNMVPGECCNAACWDTCLATMFCWGCAAAQMKRELQVWFGHAGEGAPVHPGSPAAKRG